MTTSYRTAGSTEVLTEASGRVEPVVVTAVDGPAKGARARLDSGSLRIGSGDACDLKLADKSVSRLHLTAELLRGAVLVRDANSRNGTVYLGARVQEARIPIGGSVKVGRTTLRFQSATDAAEASEREEFFGLIGRSLPMRKLFAQLEKLGPQDATVLITGEIGAGKEMVARALHQMSQVASGPFVVFDCAAVNPNLMESELFGHARGAFSGADRARAGALEQASGGTLFLDEVGELPLELQPKLLRALGQREFHRVGETVERKVSARFIAATHKDLAGEAKLNRFRLDLYYRLAVATVRVPPLRERLDDIPLLAAHFAREASGSDVPLSPQTLAALQCDKWEGNVRELKNTVARVIALGRTGDGDDDQLDLPGGDASYKEARNVVLRRFERDYLKSLLEKHESNVSAVARAAQVSRTQLYRMLKRHRLV